MTSAGGGRNGFAGDDLVRSRQVLITGGAGFLGTHLTYCFQREGIAVRLFDLAKRPGWAHTSGLEYVRGDVREPTAIAAALEGVDTVIHAAFASPRHTREAIQSINREGIRILCAEACARGVRRLLLISSTIVLKARRVHPILRDSPLTRLDLYRDSRVAAEEIVTAYGRKGLSVAIARPKTMIGPGRVSAFAILFEQVRLGRPLPVLGSGENRYQLLDIRDLAEGLRLLAATDAEGVFFFGARDFRTIREDLQSLLDHAQTEARLRFVPGCIARGALRTLELAGVVPLSEWHYLSAWNEDSVSDIARAERELGWQPQRSNAQALMEAYDWYVASVMATGMVRTTHPVPVAHRVLKRLSWILPR